MPTLACLAGAPQAAWAPASGEITPCRSFTQTLLAPPIAATTFALPTVSSLSSGGQRSCSCHACAATVRLRFANPRTLQQPPATAALPLAAQPCARALHTSAAACVPPPRAPKAQQNISPSNQHRGLETHAACAPMPGFGTARQPIGQPPQLRKMTQVHAQVNDMVLRLADTANSMEAKGAPPRALADSFAAIDGEVRHMLQSCHVLPVAHFVHLRHAGPVPACGSSLLHAALVRCTQCS